MSQQILTHSTTFENINNIQEIDEIAEERT